jgi:hypothetical protein
MLGGFFAFGVFMKLKFLCAAMATSLLAACGSSSSTTQNDMCAETASDSFSCEQMLLDSTAVAVAQTSAVSESLVQLQTDISSYCGDVASTVLQDTAKASWSAAMVEVQQLEVMQLAPIEELRDELYVWPGNNTCRTDNQIVTNTNPDMATVDSANRGLTAVEYILFSDDALAKCDTSFPDVAVWRAANTELNDRKLQRCEYAKNIVSDLTIKVDTLNTSLASFSLQDSNSSLQQAANDISDSLFYVDKFTKDLKILAVLPQASDSAFIVSALESQFADYTVTFLTDTSSAVLLEDLGSTFVTDVSKQHIVNNLQGAKALFKGGANIGLDDYLNALGQTDMATEIELSLDNAIAHAQLIDESLHKVIVQADASNISACIASATMGTFDANSNLEKTCALQFFLKQFTDLLKEDLVLALNFSKPAAADGDAD